MINNNVKYIIVLLILILSEFLLASPTDSLKIVLGLSKADTNKVWTLIALSKQYVSTDPSQAIRYAELARELSIKIRFPKGDANSLKNLGIVYYLQSKYIEALDYWKDAGIVFESMGDKVGVANMLSNAGAVYFNQGEDEKALEFHFKSLKVSEETGDKLRIATSLINIGAVYYNKPATMGRALEYYLRAYSIAEVIKDKYLVGTATVNLGEIYFAQGKEDSALVFYNKSIKAYENSENLPYSLNAIGKVYAKRGDFVKAELYQKQAFEIAKKLDARYDMVQSLNAIANTYKLSGDKQAALQAFKQALETGLQIKSNYEVKNAYEGLAQTYASLADYSNAFKYQVLFTTIKDTLYNIETDKKLSGILFNFEINKKKGEIALLTKDKEVQQLYLRRQKAIKNVTIAGLSTVMLFLFVVLSQNKKITKAKKRSDELLLNILPEETAEELKTTGAARAKSFAEVSVMFTDFKNFTQASEKLSAEELVQEIHNFYCEFDKIISKYGIEKIKTIGDSYMCAAGLPIENKTHAIDLVGAGLEMQQFIERTKEDRVEKGEPFFELRLGIHTGPVVAGIVGLKKFAYDIWGDTVNTASRMESSGQVGKVNISEVTYELIKNKFHCTHRGKVEAKNKGTIDMYFVDRPV
ncbi:MAG: adenylate/guanylate cyclase domain-containing protein [Bacteroidota bacterium]